jgi:Adenylate and Guanylate cyclase catalytic domain
MEVALLRHNAIIGEIVRVHAGYVFKTMGDSFHSAFARPYDAVAAAIDAQRALLAEEWDARCVISVRMAIHTGTATETQGDYVGQPLNQAARLLSVGHGGQVLLSGATQQLVRGRLPPDTKLRSLGEYQLRDLKHTDQVFQVVTPELPSDFPALTALRPTRPVVETAKRAPLLMLFQLGDDEGNRLRVRNWMMGRTKFEQQAAIGEVLDILREKDDLEGVENAAFVLEYVAELDLGLFPSTLIDELSRHPHFIVQSAAASILWTAATIAPGAVPLDIVVRLIVDGVDWYVVTPAQRALQQLALSRSDAMQVLIDLAGASKRDERVFAAKSFAALAAVNPAIVPRSVVAKLTQESDIEIRLDAQRAVALLPLDDDDNWKSAYGTFSAL